MKQVNIHEAKTHLSRLVEAAARGESFVIAKAGKPLVKVEAVAPEPKLPRIGFLKDVYGHLDYSPELAARLDAEIEKDFEESIQRDLDRDWLNPDAATTP